MQLTSGTENWHVYFVDFHSLCVRARKALQRLNICTGPARDFGDRTQSNLLVCIGIDMHINHEFRQCAESVN